MLKLVIPIEPKPQKRPRFNKRGIVYENKDMEAWRRHASMLVKNAYKKHKSEPFEGALYIALSFYIEPPKSISRVKKNIPLIEKEILPVAKKPDIDNFEKAIYDSMTGIAFKDDGQVAGHEVRKVYSFNPRIEMIIKEIEFFNF